MTLLRLPPVRVIAILLLLAGLIGLAWAPNPITAAAPPELRSIPPIPLTDVNPVGANFFLDREVEPWKKEQTVRMAKEAGIGWMKQIFAWEEIEPRKNYFFDDKFRKSTWEKYDQIVDLAQQHGIRIIARLDRPPVWARPEGSPETAPPTRFEDYGDFVRALVDRYKGRVQFLQIWNEPNLAVEWTGRPDAPGYARLLQIAYEQAKAADPNVVVLSAPLAQTLEESAFNLNELKYLDALYKAGAGRYFDALSANAYGFDLPPDATPNANALNFGRLQLLREVMERNGDKDKPIWFNEFGWNASPESMSPEKLIWRRVSEEQQAQYTADAIALTRKWGWVGTLNIWYFRQVGDFPIERSDYFFRMVDTDFTPRPVYDRVKAAHDRLAVATPGEYEELATPVDARGPWQLTNKPGASGGRLLQTTGDTATLSIRFSGTGIGLIMPPPAEPVRLLAKVDGSQSAVDIPAGGGEFVLVPLVKGLRPGEHTIALERVSGPAWGFDRVAVEMKPDFGPFFMFAGLALVGGLLVAASFMQNSGKR